MQFVFEGFRPGHVECLIEVIQDDFDLIVKMFCDFS